MKINIIYYSNHFAQSFQHLPEHVKQEVTQQEKTFRNNCFDKSLEVSHLNNVLHGLWRFKITSTHTILFEFCESPGTVGFIDIAQHDIYR